MAITVSKKAFKNIEFIYRESKYLASELRKLLCNT